MGEAGGVNGEVCVCTCVGGLMGRWMNGQGGEVSGWTDRWKRCRDSGPREWIGWGDKYTGREMSK